MRGLRSIYATASFLSKNTHGLCSSLRSWIGGSLLVLLFWECRREYGALAVAGIFDVFILGVIIRGREIPVLDSCICSANTPLEHA